MSPKQIKEKQKRDNIAKELEKTGNFYQISKKLNVCQWLVSDVAKSLGIESKNSRVKNLEPEMERLFKLGMNITDISKSLKVQYDRVGRYIKSKGYTYSPVNKKYLDSDIFSVIDNEEKAYWLGFFYADGCITGTNRFEISLQEKDLKHLEKLKSFLKYNGNISYKSKVKAYRIIFSDTIFYNNLFKLGCMPRKSLILEFPTESQVPKELQRHFVRGYFDGDGHIHNSDNVQIGIKVLGTLNFLSKFKQLYKHHNNCLSHDNRHHSNISIFSLFGKNCIEFMNNLYENSNIYLDRKYERYVKSKIKHEKTGRDSTRNN